MDQTTRGVSEKLVGEYLVRGCEHECLAKGCNANSVKGKALAPEIHGWPYKFL